MLSIFRSFLVSMALVACVDAHATAMYDYSVSYGGGNLTGSFDAVATGNSLSSITDMTLFINGQVPTQYTFDYIMGWNTNNAIVSLTPGVSDFTFGTFGLFEIGVSSAQYNDGQAYLNGTWTHENSQISIVLDPNQPAVPEPATLLLAGAGLACLAWSRRKYGSFPQALLPA